MGLLDKLIEAPGTGMAIAGGHEVRTLDISGAGEPQVLGTLVTTFGRDRSCAEIRVLRDGGLLGIGGFEAPGDASVAHLEPFALERLQRAAGQRRGGRAEREGASEGATGDSGDGHGNVLYRAAADAAAGRSGSANTT